MPILIDNVVPEELKLTATLPRFLCRRWCCRGGDPGQGCWRSETVRAQRRHSYSQLGLSTC
jgi:hypothetical protein